LAALCDGGRIGLEDLPAMIRQARPAVSSTVEAPSEHPLDDAERLALLNALEHTRWHMTHTAEQLGVSRNTLYRKLRKHGIER
ncbi:helix-turn-helix domain-containing protein, partial [Paraburkholderia sp. SIMBA_049]